mmetsp:Transcript_51433/g.151596  ORF Transcript_51433/g.151596 Transcript_51433/m.151596 type:complete len:215 (-) Transcript_51433:172-816(-)
MLASRITQLLFVAFTSFPWRSTGVLDSLCFFRMWMRCTSVGWSAARRRLPPRMGPSSSSSLLRPTLFRSSPQSSIATPTAGVPPSLPQASMRYTTSMPSTTRPKTTCFPSRCGQVFVVMKNCEPLVFLPLLAMLRMPGTVCFRLRFSSAKVWPKMDSPPVPSPCVKSPPWIMKFGMMRWKGHPLKCSGEPLLPFPRAPVQSERKFSAVRGTTSM